ncbi:hypothetical protein F7984_05100 [Pradoshia sp. D12]|uniref:2'-5' RNA ligase family protein n=1 Tax=Bacillaceae TaxID=186817 RepID=UPI00080AF953|nr:MULTISPECIES: 2'-5' RNA ligase family protein [Bacillaceae]OCA89934.1 hypothetical protein A8L44_03110 [Bacillus sp. FJAT-27986]QFK70661.1 hypothetical protein F7984_05100 [Pradoshia sp. D12]TPF72456.1 hypothetical protein FHY44_01495 [Bacillus sp. D12]
MNFGIAIFPSKNLQDIVNSYRKRYDSHYSRISPHVTLKSEFTATDEQIKEISAKLEEIANQHQPFTLKVLKVSTFQPVNNVIYLKIDPTAELSALHEDFHNDILGKDKKYKFVPHITIGQDLSDKEHNDILGQLRLMKFEHEEVVDHFHLLYQTENGAWKVYETYQLRKDN